MARTPQDENKAYDQLDYNRNYDDVFMRCVSLGVVDEMQDRIGWVNRFSDGDRKVSVRFRHALTGDENFNIDQYLDDVPDETRVNGNVDPVPRAAVWPGSWSIASSEFTNPDIRVIGHVDDRGKVTQITGKMKSIPINASFNIKVELDNALDAYRYSERFSAALWPFRFFTFKYNQFLVQGAMNVPDGKSIDIPRSINMTSENRPTIEHSVEIKTYQPVLSDVQAVNKGRVGQWHLSLWDQDIDPEEGYSVSMARNKPDDYHEQIRALDELARRKGC